MGHANDNFFQKSIFASTLDKLNLVGWWANHPLGGILPNNWGSMTAMGELGVSPKMGGIWELWEVGSDSVQVSDIGCVKSF